MKRHWNFWLGWMLWGIISVISIILTIVKLSNTSPESSVIQLVGDMIVILIPMIFGFLAALLISRQPNNVIGWLLMLPAAIALIGGPVEEYLLSFGAQTPPATPINILFAWFVTWGWLLYILPILFIPLLFPSGSPPSPRWRWVIPAGLILGVIFVFLATFSQEIHAPGDETWTFVNPIGFINGTLVDNLIFPWIVCLGLLAIICASALLLRFRNAKTTEREQIKWVLFASSIFAILYVIYLSSDIQSSESILRDIFNILSDLTVLAIPVAITIAILRYRLWDIDVIIRRTLLYGALSALLALVFFGLVVLLQQVFGALTGTENSPIIIVISTLAIAALFNPLRHRLQELIDRRFYRRKYNAEQALTAFSETARSEADLDQLNYKLLQVLQETYEPEWIKVWQKEGRK